MFKNTAALVAYNSYVKPEKQFELNSENMNKFVEAIVNAFKTNNLVVTDENPSTQPLTTETLTNALSKAFEGIDLTPEIPENAVQDAVSNFFANGLPENVLNQIKEAVTPQNFTESEDYTKLTSRIEDIETKVANGAGQAKPTGKSTSEVQEDKYDVEGIGWSEKAN